MLKILRDKFISLGRDEDGAALVVTLAVFMFIYVLFAGIYAVGVNVRTRIHLQNACDAAAYSAAVVQADTLSRIATINRAMSWTYVQMTRRQMDYIVWKWLDETVKLVKEDVTQAKNTGSPGDHSHGHDYWSLKPTLPLKFHCGRLDSWRADAVEISLNGTHGEKPKFIDDKNSSFANGHFHDESFYNGKGSNIGVLRAQITADKNTLNDLYAKETELASLLPDRVEDAVTNILLASTGIVPERNTNYIVVQNPVPYGDSDPSRSYFEILGSGEELRFLGFAGYSPPDASRPFDKGSGNAEWFRLEGSEGFLRNYVQSGALYSEWHWGAWRWHCPYHGACFYTKAGSGNGRCLAEDCRDPYFRGEAAKPLVLRSGYFGPAGTITVGLVATNANPWAWIGNVSQGIFSAFNPFVSKTFCVASAKAGYRNFTAGQNFGRDYRIDWRSGDSLDPDDEQYWNLYTSDWDAVMVPVPRAASTAINGRWSVAVPDALGGIAARLGLGTGDFTAGGAGNAQWQIENPGRAISSWGALQRRMWH